MTKKFWADWQRRVGETKQIYVASMFLGNRTFRYVRGLLKKSYDEGSSEKIISTKFHGDAVDMVIERKILVQDFLSKRGYHYNAENEYITLHRNDIVSVEFKDKEL